MSPGGTGGVELPITWRGRRVKAFVATLLAQRPLELSAATINRTATAAVTLAAAAGAWKVLDLMPRHLVLTSAVVARELGATTRSATSALNELVRAGILVRHEPPGERVPGRPAGLFISPDLLGLAGSQPT